LYEEVRNMRALLAFAVALNAQAKEKDKYKKDYSGPVALVPKKDYNGPVASVPDNGSTALLSGTAIVALALASRRFAIGKPSSNYQHLRPGIGPRWTFCKRAVSLQSGRSTEDLSIAYVFEKKKSATRM
jgi:VPDSG-CTERM motif